MPQRLATARHLPRIVYLFQSLQSLCSVVPAAVWKADWEAHHRRVGELLDQHHLQIFEDPEALMTCHLDPYKALCDPDLAKGPKPSLRTPNWNRCNPSCVNISRTDTQIQRAREQLAELYTDRADPHLPHPIRRRLELCCASREKIIQAYEGAPGRTADKEST